MTGLAKNPERDLRMFLNKGLDEVALLDRLSLIWPHLKECR